MALTVSPLPLDTVIVHHLYHIHSENMEKKTPLGRGDNFKFQKENLKLYFDKIMTYKKYPALKLLKSC